MQPKGWNILMAGLVVTTPVAIVAHAEIYLTEDQAAAVLFPGVRVKLDLLYLTPAEMKNIEKASGEKVPSPKVRFWQGAQQGALFIDRVIGKHDFITYAVALDPGGRVKGVEILEYREYYGYQVRNKAWRDQFIGKGKNDALKVKKDIQNISGATISAFHVTNGVRRIIETYETIKTRLR